MKKFKIALLSSAVLLSAFLIEPIGAKTNPDPQRPDMVCWEFTVNGTSRGICIDYDGDILPVFNNDSDIGESTRAFRVGYFNSLNVASGIVNVSETFLDAAAVSTTALAALTVTSTTLVNSGTTYVYSVPDFIQPDVPRTIVLRSSWIAGNSTATISLTALVIGSASTGQYLRESVSFSTTPGASNNAFAYVSSITITGVSGATMAANCPLRIEIGVGENLGLSNPITSSTDLYHFWENGVSITSATVNTTYNTWRSPTATNGAVDRIIKYKTKKSSP